MINKKDLCLSTLHEYERLSLRRYYLPNTEERIKALEAELLKEYTEEMESKNYSPLWEWDEVFHREQLRSKKRIFSGLYSCVQELQQEERRLEHEEKRINEKYKKLINLDNRLNAIKETLSNLSQNLLTALIVVLAAPIFLIFVMPFQALSNFIKGKIQGD